MQNIQVPYFGSIDVEIDDGADVGDVETSSSGGTATLAAFLAKTEADRLADTRHVYAYYQDFRAAIDGTSLDREMGVPETPDAIWKHVHPTQIHLMAGQEDEHCYLVVVCDCDWEREHGLRMVWRDGTTLCKVGGDDGHITNAYAYDDDSLTDVVYPGIDESYRTFIDR